MRAHAAIKNQRKVSKKDSYGIRLLAGQLLGTFLDIKWRTMVPGHPAKRSPPPAALSEVGRGRDWRLFPGLSPQVSPLSPPQQGQPRPRPLSAHHEESGAEMSGAGAGGSQLPGGQGPLPQPGAGAHHPRHGGGGGGGEETGGAPAEVRLWGVPGLVGGGSHPVRWSPFIAQVCLSFYTERRLRPI